MRTSNQKVNDILKKQLLSTFTGLIIDLKKEEEIRLFLEDFFNESELETFIKRLGVFYWLKKGRSYNNIKENLKVSSATIATAQESIKKPGIALAIKYLEADEWANVWADRIKSVMKTDKK